MKGRINMKFKRVCIALIRLVKKLDVSYDHLFLQFKDKKTVKR